MLFCSLFKRLFSPLLILLYTAPALAEFETVVLYAVDYPPYMVVESDDNISGIDVEVTQAAFAAVGITTDVKTAPWKRILKNIEHGRIAGTLSCSRRPDREEFIFFSDKVNEINQVAIMSRSRDDSQLNKLDDLKNFRVIAVEDWGNQRELARRGVEHQTTAEMDNGINSVVFRDVDVFYNGEMSTKYRARQLGLHDNIKAKRLSDKKSTPLHLCLSKKYPGAAVLTEKFNEGLGIIKANGVFKAIYSKYL